MIPGTLSRCTRTRKCPMEKRPLNQIDPAIFSIITRETDRQNQELNLIASENYASPAVMQATGSILTNKYAEGYPGKRYYGGCELVDQAELLAIDRCKQLFHADHVNVQPHAGSQAHMTAFASVLNPGDTVLGMALAAGGHLTHGHSVNFSGLWYKSFQYGVDKETGLIDYDHVENLAQEHKPKLIIAGASAYARTLDFERFSHIAQSVGAYFMADIAHIAGLVAAKLHPSPIPYADLVTSTTHKTLRGPRGGLIMSKAQLSEKVDRAIMPGLQGGPFMNVIAAKAVAFHEALQPTFIAYQEQIINNAQAMVAACKEVDFTIVTGGTDTHLFVIDLRNKNVNGKIAEAALAKAGISVSRSCIPFDPEKPWITSGIRVGTPAITTRGMQAHHAQEIIHLIHETMLKHNDPTALAHIKERVHTLCKQFPVY